MVNPACVQAHRNAGAAAPRHVDGPKASPQVAAGSPVALATRGDHVPVSVFAQVDGHSQIGRIVMVPP